jgi:hypothetical protein
VNLNECYVYWKTCVTEWKYMNVSVRLERSIGVMEYRSVDSRYETLNIKTPTSTVTP